METKKWKEFSKYFCYSDISVITYLPEIRENMRMQLENCAKMMKGNENF